MKETTLHIGVLGCKPYSNPKICGNVQVGYVELDTTAFNALNDQQKREYKVSIKKDNEALFLIQGAINQAIFPRISGAIHSQQAWKILNNAYQGAQTAKLQTMRKTFENVKMTTSESVNQFLTKVEGLVSQMKVLGEDVDDKHVIEKILRSLISKFDGVVSTIEISKDLTTMQIDELSGILLTAEERMKSNEESLEQAFSSKASIRGKRNTFFRNQYKNEYKGESSNFRGRGNNFRGRSSNFRGTGRGRGRNNGGDYDKKNVQCFHCNKFGHYASDCWSKQGETEKRNAHSIVENKICLCLALMQMPMKIMFGILILDVLHI